MLILTNFVQSGKGGDARDDLVPDAVLVTPCAIGHVRATMTHPLS
jgi:GntR family transcriptional regulator, vanillate catabolism transcriptional regulator